MKAVLQCPDPMTESLEVLHRLRAEGLDNSQNITMPLSGMVVSGRLG